MKKQTLLFSLLLVALVVVATAFTTSTKEAALSPKDKALDLITAMEKVNGGWAALAALKDVQYDYEYDDKAKGKDMSTERYIFDGEISWAEYSEHEVNVMPGVKGHVKQCLMNDKPEITLNDEQVTDPKALGGTTFLRKANYFWFTMMYKLKDAEVIQEYSGTEEVNGITYDKVTITYGNTGKPANDQYVLYFNPKTHLVDLFYFSLPAMGVNDPVLRQELTYEKISGVYVATVRKGIYPDANGNYALGGVYTYRNVKFNNGFTKEDMAL